MIDVKEAVKIAIEDLQKLYESAELKDILLEEFALSDDEKYWYVTLGFSRQVDSKSPLSALLGKAEYNQEYKRVYKEFQIDRASGQVKSMKIRAA